MKFDNKSLIINHPALIAEWDWDKNIELKLEPNELLCGSNKKAWWRCALGHSWEAVIAERANGSGCPYCANKKVLAGYNDLASTNPELISEWNYSKNTELKVDGVTASSLKKVWWICEKGHEWEAAIASRTSGSGCPICANRKVLKGYNDLQALFPAVAAEWHPTKNGETTPDEVLAGTNAKFWWQCKFGHEWQCSVVDRRRRSSGRPICSENQI